MKRGAKRKSCGRKLHRIPSPDRARKPEWMPPIHEDNFEDIGGYPFEEPQLTATRAEQCEIPSVKEFMSGGKTPEKWRQLADILSVMQE